MQHVDDVHGKARAMADALFTAGQVLSVVGLAYGWFLSLTCCDYTDATRAIRDKTRLLHHLAMA
jgi:hypothetical protein